MPHAKQVTVKPKIGSNLISFSFKVTLKLINENSELNSKPVNAMRKLFHSCPISTPVNIPKKPFVATATIEMNINNNFIVNKLWMLQ